MTFQNLILKLSEFWTSRGCTLQQPLDVEVGAGTMHPETFLRVLGPAPAPISRIKNRYRWQVLVKARSRPDARDALDLALSQLGEKHAALRALTIEVDPVNLM